MAQCPQETRVRIASSLRSKREKVPTGQYGRAGGREVGSATVYVASTRSQQFGKICSMPNQAHSLTENSTPRGLSKRDSCKDEQRFRQKLFIEALLLVGRD